MITIFSQPLLVFSLFPVAAFQGRQLEWAGVLYNDFL